MAGSLLVGVGNPSRRDDGAGPAVAARLRDKRSGRVVEHGGEPASLIDLWRDAEEVVIVDAIHSGAPAGTVRRFDAAAAPLPTGICHSTHALGLAEALELARALGHLPAHVVVYGIETADVSFGTGLSEPVEAAVGRLVEELGDA